MNHRVSIKRPLNIECLEIRRLLAVAAVEQEAVYVLNRARHNPVAYQNEQKLPVSLASVAPKGPLAVNDSLFDSAEVKAIDMAINNYFDHLSPLGVTANQLARSAGYPLPSFLPTNANNIESIAAGTDFTSSFSALNVLTIDAGLPGAPHRVQLFGMDDFFGAHREIGVGLATSPTARFSNYWAIHTATREIPTNFVTGVVFDDLNNDGRYNAGEGLSGVAITVGDLNTTTNAHGGWSVAVEAGQHNVVARGGAFTGVSTATAIVSDQNVAVDFLSGKPSSEVSFSEQFARNVDDEFDVDGSGDLSSIDALLVINFLQRQSASGAGIYSKPVFLDVSGNGVVDVLDGLRVVNALLRNSQTTTDSEGETLALSWGQSSSQRPSPFTDHRIRSSDATSTISVEAKPSNEMFAKQLSKVTDAEVVSLSSTSDAQPGDGTNALSHRIADAMQREFQADAPTECLVAFLQ